MQQLSWDRVYSMSISLSLDVLVIGSRRIGPRTVGPRTIGPRGPTIRGPTVGAQFTWNPCYLLNIYSIYSQQFFNFISTQICTTFE